jgi:hypothetical protein
MPRADACSPDMQVGEQGAKVITTPAEFEPLTPEEQEDAAIRKEGPSDLEEDVITRPHHIVKV